MERLVKPRGYEDMSSFLEILRHLFGKDISRAGVEIAKNYQYCKNFV